MDFNDSTHNLSVLNDFSMITMKTQTIAFILWIIFCSLNISSALVIAYTLYMTKILHTDTQLYLVNSNLGQGAASLSFLCCAVYHLRNIIYDLPETVKRYTCYLVIGHQSLFLSVSNTFTLIVAFDRFYAKVFPTSYKMRSQKAKYKVNKLLSHSEMYSCKMFARLLFHIMSQFVYQKYFCNFVKVHCKALFLMWYT